MMKKGHNVPLRSALANLLKRLEFITRRACLRGGMPVHGQDFASRCPALTMAMILNQYPKEVSLNSAILCGTCLTLTNRS